MMSKRHSVARVLAAAGNFQDEKRTSAPARASVSASALFWTGREAMLAGSEYGSEIEGACEYSFVVRKRIVFWRMRSNGVEDIFGARAVVRIFLRVGYIVYTD